MSALIEPPQTASARALSNAWDAMHRDYFPDHDIRWGWVMGQVHRHCRSLARTTPRGVVIDLGCGIGSLTARLAAALDGVDVIGLDLDPALIGIAEAAAWPGTSFRVGTERDLAAVAAERPVVAVVSSAVLHYHCADSLRRSRQWVSEALMPGGVCVEVDCWGSASTEGMHDAWGRWWCDAARHEWCARLIRTSQRPQTQTSAKLATHRIRDCYLDAGFASAVESRLDSGSTGYVARTARVN